jgi:hypothetical protein
MSRLLVALALTISIIGTARANAKPVIEHQLTEADHIKIDAMADEMFARLQAGSIDKAVEGFLGTTGLMAGKKAQLTQVAAQISTTIDIYGPISNCILVQSDGKGGIVEEQEYICQHENLVTRWKLLFVKTTKGWIAGNLYFDDKPMRDD